MADLLQGFTESSLKGQLPTSVSESIATLEREKLDWDAIGNVLASVPAMGISLKGGANWSGTLWHGVKKEFHSFLCTDSPVYADLRKEGNGLQQKSSSLAVAALSGAIGAQLGVASGVVAPLVIWATIVALRIGKQAICSALSGPPGGPPSPSP